MRQQLQRLDIIANRAPSDERCLDGVNEGIHAGLQAIVKYPGQDAIVSIEESDWPIVLRCEAVTFFVYGFGTHPFWMGVRGAI